jgi:branched-chain amino acid transport system ATP-binding protein
VSGVTISVGPGEVVSVIGPNGAGKSTLLKAVTGRLPVMTGTVTFGDRDITNMCGHRLARLGLGFVPQTKDVFDTLTVTENLEMGGYLLTKPQLTARIEAVLSTFPALADMRVQNREQAQRRRAEDARGSAGPDARTGGSRP